MNELDALSTALIVSAVMGGLCIFAALATLLADYLERRFPS